MNVRHMYLYLRIIGILLIVFSLLYLIFEAVTTPAPYATALIIWFGSAIVGWICITIASILESNLTHA